MKNFARAARVAGVERLIASIMIVAMKGKEPMFSAVDR